MKRREEEPMNYYEDPYAISREEAREMRHLPITPQEANYIIVNSIANDVTIPQDTLRALRQIRDSEDGGDIAVSLRDLDNND